MSIEYIIASVIAVLNMWMMLNQFRIKEEMSKKFLTLEKELTKKMEDMETRMEERMPTKEQLRFMKKEFRMFFINIATQLKLSTKGFDIDKEDY